MARVEPEDGPTRGVRKKSVQERHLNRSSNGRKCQGSQRRMLEEVEGDGKKPLDFATWRRFFNLGKSNFSGRKTQVWQEQMGRVK